MVYRQTGEENMNLKNVIRDFEEAIAMARQHYPTPSVENASLEDVQEWLNNILEWAYTSIHASYGSLGVRDYKRYVQRVREQVRTRLH